jgi:pimeloyl-ACP methyl ester carboxylesterase
VRLALGGVAHKPWRALQAEEALQAVAQLHTMIIPGCGHWIQQERPDEVTGELLTFLRQHIPLPVQARRALVGGEVRK